MGRAGIDRLPPLFHIGGEVFQRACRCIARVIGIIDDDQIRRFARGNCGRKLLVEVCESQVADIEHILGLCCIEILSGSFYTGRSGAVSP